MASFNNAIRPLLNLQIMLLSCMLALVLSPLTLVTGHGFLSTPRSRNLVAYEDRIYHGETETTPYPEDCPTCINRGGTLARCGILEAQGRNYDFPKNAFGDPMPPNPQERYVEGGEIDIEVTLSAHHRGHFVFKACPIAFTTISPTQECFDMHPLMFVKDKLYGAPVDMNFPERAYVAPAHHPRRVQSDKPTFEKSMIFQFTMRLPEGLVGELVLIQWYYVAGNSGCAHTGYEEYPWPEDWIHNLNEDEEISEWESKVSVGTGLKSCEELGGIPPDGNGVPEQFWNCAEVSIVPNSEAGSLGAGGGGAPIEQLQSDKTIIAYWASWQWYDRNKLAEPWVFDYRKYTRINFGFFQTNEEGWLWGTDSWADPNCLFGPYNWNGEDGDPLYCSWDNPGPGGKVCSHHFYDKGLIHLAKQAGAEIWPSIGGWSLSDPFPVMAKNEVSRKRFAQQCIELIEDHGFDGIDIDWEYPGYEAHSGTPDDTVSYNLLLEEVRKRLDELGEKNGRFYGLTAALPCGTNHINNIDVEVAAGFMSELNLMTYDFFGAWSETTGCNAPLYDQNWGPPEVARYSIDGCVKNWIERGASPDKINIGLPFYGRGFMTAKHLNETHPNKPDKATWWQDEGIPQYFNIVTKLPELVSVRHELTMTQYAYNDKIVNGKDEGGMVSYDDEEAICDKTQYCMDHSLNGFIIWEVSGDLMEDLSTPLIDAVHAKLSDPSLDCKEFRYDKGTFSGYATPRGNEAVAKFKREEPIFADDNGAIGDSSEPAMTCPTPWFRGLQTFDFCQASFHCTNGKPDESTITYCSEGQLFDPIDEVCKDASQVTCPETAPPTGQPTPNPVAYIPECPPGISGFKPGPDCRSYYHCHDGKAVSTMMQCSPGTLFDETISSCTFAANVQCTITSNPTQHPSYKPTHQPLSPTHSPTYNPFAEQANIQNKPLILAQTSRPTVRPSQNPSPMPSPNPTRQPTLHPVTTVPTPKPSFAAAQSVLPPTKKPRRQRTPRPTLGRNSMASTFLDKPSPLYTILDTTEPVVVEYRPSKGEESFTLAKQIENQIKKQKMKVKNKKVKQKQNPNRVQAKKKKRNQNPDMVQAKKKQKRNQTKKKKQMRQKKKDEKLLKRDMST